MKEAEKDNDSEEKLGTLVNAAQSGAAAEVVQRYGEAVKEHFVAFSGADNETGMQLKRGLKAISKSKVNPEYEKQNLKQQAGYSAEVKYTARENAERVIKGEKTRIQNTDLKGSGGYNELFDHVEIDAHGNIIAENGEQMKFVGKDPKAALKALESKKFEKYLDADAKITVPKDFYEGYKDAKGEHDGIIAEIDKLISGDKSAKRNTGGLQGQLAQAKEKGNTALAEKLEARIAKLKKIRSSLKNSGITSKESMEARLHPVISTAQDITKLSHRAGVEQAKYGAAFGGSVSLVRNLVAVIKGEEDADEAALSVAKDTAQGAAVSYATAFAGSALKGAMQNSKQEVVRALSKSNFAAEVVTVAIESGKTLARYVNGEIDGVQCLEELGEKGVGMTSSAMLAAEGAAVGTLLLPGVGTMLGGIIGSMVGYVVGSSCYGVLLGSLKRANLAHEERLRIERECAEAVALIRQYRAELEAAVSEYFCDHIAVFTDAFDKMNRAIGLDDIDGFMAGANAVTAKLGGKVQFANYGEFESFMESGATLRL